MATGTKRQKAAARRVGEQADDGHLTHRPLARLGELLPRSRGANEGAARRVRSAEGNGEALARGLGWFSIGLGLAEVAAPRAIAKIVGVRGGDDNNLLIRALGLREMAHGVAILTRRRPAAAVWSRVAGDAIDLACLGAAYASPDSDKRRVTFATVNVLAVAALDVLCARQLSARGDDGDEWAGARLTNSLVINRAPEELYQRWRDFESLPAFMHHLESVRVTGEARSHWVAKAPAGASVEWDAEITEDRPGELIAWRSLEGADVYNAGLVRFEPAAGNRGTIVTVEIKYDPPGGLIGADIAKLFGEDPSQQVKADLRRFKQLVETGEVVVSDATLRGTGLTEQRPAQPAGGEGGR
ncbi:MAG: SRPBCC family protein [Pyrinomonadaceae bacterium]